MINPTFPFVPQPLTDGEWTELMRATHFAIDDVSEADQLEAFQETTCAARFDVDTHAPKGLHRGTLYVVQELPTVDTDEYGAGTVTTLVRDDNGMLVELRRHRPTKRSGVGYAGRIPHRHRPAPARLRVVAP